MSTLLTEPATTEPAPNGVTAAAAEPNVTTPATPDIPADGARWTVPEDLRATETFRKFMDDKSTVDPTVVLKSYHNLESTMGRDKIPVPKSDEDWGKVYDALGRPESPEMYEVTKPDLPEGMTYDEEGEKFIRNFAHQNGWNQKQFTAAFDAFFQHQKDQVAGWSKLQSESRGKVEEDLKRDWGQAFEQNTGIAKAAMIEYADPEFSQFLETSGLGNDPRMVRFMHKVGKELLGETKLMGTGNGTGALTPAELDAKISEFRKTNERALFDSEHPQHREMVDQLTRLTKMKFGE